MVNITKGQILKDNPDLKVFSDSGSYDENDLVLCGHLEAIEPICFFEAQYVVNGHEAYDQTVIPT